MPLFGKSKEQKAEEALAGLLFKIPVSATLFVKSLSESLGISDSMTKWEVHTELLGLLCHIVSRWAFAIGGPAFRAYLQDRVTLHTINVTVDSTWDSSKADRQFDFEEWKERMKKELLHNISAAELEYAECKQFISSEEQKQSWLFRDDNVLGRFAGNIAQLSEAGPIAGRLAAGLAAVELLAKSGIRQDIEGVWRNTR